jgi:hypothetical protein
MLRRRVQEQAAEVLLRLRVPQARLEHEVEQMSDAVFSRTAGRRVVGVLVDFAYQLQAAGRSSLARSIVFGRRRENLDKVTSQA